MTLKPNNIVIMNDQIAIKWNDASESLIDNKTLRLQCPCANCSGESDVFGNIYKSNNLKTNNENQYLINRYIYIGHYAIRIVWRDGHNAGIYSFEFLKSLDA
ncbi:MAG: hypothetical protein CMG25_03510 [Candidatus Marinimicrobia bacterium]|nr:hypothetical protein [Candidatus Neomarinimicrobiota bacterium]|tara:strand:+ start:30224 stop:30529 length:306 start_codon:yes stop_codon:yes gene_type:complete